MSKKPDMYDLFNDESLWGNQETGALSHEDIMDKNWNRKKSSFEIEQAISRHKDKEWRAQWEEKNMARFNSSEFREQMANSIWNNKTTHEKRKIAMAETWKDQDKIQKQRQDTLDRWKDPKFASKAKRRMREGCSRPEVKARRKIMEQEKWSDQETKANILRKAGQCTPIQSDGGIFLSVTEAADFYNMSYGMVRERLKGIVKTNEHNFKYITWEEYDNIKGGE